MGRVNGRSREKKKKDSAELFSDQLLLPEVESLAFSFRIQYFKPQSAILGPRKRTIRAVNSPPLTTHSQRSIL
jgi:hypothetical protein